jgi:hypothetical protein
MLSALVIKKTDTFAQRRECSGDAGTPENQADRQKIDLLKHDSGAGDEVSAIMIFGNP